jgi:hypothetical protein
MLESQKEINQILEDSGAKDKAKIKQGKNYIFPYNFLRILNDNET